MAQSPTAAANPTGAPASAFGRLLRCHRTGQEFMPTTISFKNSEQRHAEARRGDAPAPFMPLGRFADYVGLPLYLLQSYVEQRLLSVVGSADDRYVEVEVAKRELSTIAARNKFPDAA